MHWLRKAWLVSIQLGAVGEEQNGVIAAEVANKLAKVIVCRIPRVNTLRSMTNKI